MQKLYRININHFEDPLKNEGFWIWLGSEEEKRSSGIVCLMTAKEVWGAGIIIRKNSR